MAFHGFPAVAPLKFHLLRRGLLHQVGAFHGFPAVPPLKSAMMMDDSRLSASFPRLPGRGYIEVSTPEAITAPRCPDFHGFPAVAPLKFRPVQREPLRELRFPRLPGRGSIEVRPRWQR